MGIDAVAVLHLPFDQVTRGLEPHDRVAGAFRSQAGPPVRIVAAGDATLVHTMARFGSEPDELGLALRWLLGDVVDQHPDQRGIFVFPDVAEPKAAGYAALIEEIGEAGFWVPRVAADHVPSRLEQASPGSFDAALRDLLGALPPGTLGELGRAAAGMDPTAMAKAAEQLQAALGGRNGELMAALEQSLGAAQQLLGAQGGAGDLGLPFDPSALPFNIPDEQQAPELWRHAREQAEAMRQKDPERFAALERKLGLGPPDDSGAGAPEPDPTRKPRGSR